MSNNHNFLYLTAKPPISWLKVIVIFLLNPFIMNQLNLWWVGCISQNPCKNLAWTLQFSIKDTMWWYCLAQIQWKNFTRTLPLARRTSWVFKIFVWSLQLTRKCMLRGRYFSFKIAIFPRCEQKWNNSSQNNKICHDYDVGRTYIDTNVHVTTSS